MCNRVLATQSPCHLGRKYFRVCTTQTFLVKASNISCVTDSNQCVSDALHIKSQTSKLGIKPYFEYLNNTEMISDSTSSLAWGGGRDEALYGHFIIHF